MFKIEDLPCPSCGQYTLIGYSYYNERGEFMHTRYRCTFWKSGISDDRWQAAYKPCDWDGWSVPGWRSDEEAAEARAVAVTKTLTSDQSSATVTPMTTDSEYELQLGGMTLKQRVGGVDIEVRDGPAVRIQSADLAEVVAFLDGNTWQDSAVEVDYRWHQFTNAKTPLEQARAIAELNNAMHSLKTWLPGYDYETGTLPWERDDD